MFELPHMEKFHKSFSVLRLPKNEQRITNNEQRRTKFARQLALAAIALMAGNAMAYELPAGDKNNSYIDVEVENIALDGDKINVDLSLDLSHVKMNSNTETVYTPMFVNGTDTLSFPSFTVIGRNRLYYDRRNDAGKSPLVFYKGKLVENLLAPSTKRQVLSTSPKGTTPILTHGGTVGDDHRATLNYSAHYSEWLNNATFTIGMESFGCANCLKDIDGVEWLPLAQNELVTHAVYMPEFIYVTPVAEAVKTRDISARAYVDFVVNRTEINPNYRRNPQELGKIRATIDSIRSDRDITVRSLHISGTASPEGSYENNVRLAKGRTESLKNYVQSLYHFPYGFITTSYEPVDWQGLREFLEMVISLQNGGGMITPKDSIRMDQFKNIYFDPYTIGGILPSAQAILNIVNGSLEPYQKNQSIKNNYGSQYQWLLQNVYPALRHSDYRISFEIRGFSEVSEIIEIMLNQPQKLSLAELFVAANSQPEGSELYNKAFEIAVRMYPEDETANLNAGVNAMKRGDLFMAERYLEKAGASAEADFNRAMLAQMQGNSEKALMILRSIAGSSNNVELVQKAAAAISAIEDSLLPDTFVFKKVM